MTQRRRPSGLPPRPPRMPTGRAEPAAIAASPGYPSPSAVRRIRGQRAELLSDLSVLLSDTMHPIPGEPSEPIEVGLTRLSWRYGVDEVTRMLEYLKQDEGSNRDLIGDDQLARRRYRRSFAGFAGQQPYLSSAEFDKAMMPLMFDLAARKLPGIAPDRRLSRREHERLEDATLTYVPFCMDILPPAVPPRPADFTAPVAGHYAEPVATLLTWGPDDDPARLAAALQDRDLWLSASAELARMAVDPGLYFGWPGEPAAWAPYHALAALRILGAAEQAAAVAPLLGRADDWLSDCLPDCWGQMGPPALPVLWRLLDDSALGDEQRAFVAQGLRRVAEQAPAERPAVVAGLLRRLEDDQRPASTLNAYLIYILDRMDAHEAAPAIRAAFDGEYVNAKVMTPDAVGLLNDEEWR
jgi:hypothetical protein